MKKRSCPWMYRRGCITCTQKLLPLARTSIIPRPGTHLNSPRPMNRAPLGQASPSGGLAISPGGFRNHPAINPRPSEVGCSGTRSPLSNAAPSVRKEVDTAPWGSITARVVRRCRRTSLHDLLDPLPAGAPESASMIFRIFVAPQRISPPGDLGGR